MRAARRVRLAWEFLLAYRRSNIVLGIAIALAVGGTMVLGTAGRVIGAQQSAAARRLFGSADITLAPDSHPYLTGGRGWTTEDQLREIGELLSIASLEVQPRIVCDAVLRTGTDLTPVQLIAARSPPARPDSTPTDEADLLIGVSTTRFEPGARSGFLRLEDAAGHLTRDPQDANVVWIGLDTFLTAAKQEGIAPPDAVGNELLLTGTDDRSPAVVAYDAAELLAETYPNATVTSSLDHVGRWRQLSADNLSRLLQLFLILPAVAAVVGNVLVSLEVRRDQIALLGTLGYDSPEIRALFVREFLLVSVAATVLGLAAGMFVAAVAFGQTAGTEPLFGPAVLGIVLPVGLAFLVVWRTLRRSAGPQLVEFGR